MNAPLSRIAALSSPLVLVLAMGLGSADAVAQSDGETPVDAAATESDAPATDKPKYEFPEMGDDTIEGELIRPEGAATEEAPSDENKAEGESTAPSISIDHPADSPCPKGIPCLSAGKFAVWPKMRLRTGYELQQPDPDVLFIGNNDGFFLDQARIGFAGAYGPSLDWVIVLDAAALLPGAEPNDPVQPLVGGMVDAYVHWAPIEWFQIWAGQSFMPTDREGSTSRGSMVFTERSVASGGVRAGRGYQVSGLSEGREIGLVVGAKDAKVGPVALDYRFALANGNGSNVFGNDNKLPTAYARFGLAYEDLVAIGFGGHYDPRTTGEVPNLYNETDLQGFADLWITALGFDILVQGIARQTSFDTLIPDVTDPARSAWGFGVTSWFVVDEPFGLPMFGIKPGYRISYYDPTTSFSDDQLIEHTLGMRWDPHYGPLPFAILVDATMLMEIDDSGIRPLDNNRLTAMFQLNF